MNCHRIFYLWLRCRFHRLHYHRSQNRFVSYLEKMKHTMRLLCFQYLKVGFGGGMRRSQGVYEGSLV
jgi:hypothetical protein